MCGILLFIAVVQHRWEHVLTFELLFGQNLLWAFTLQRCMAPLSAYGARIGQLFMDFAPSGGRNRTPVLSRRQFPIYVFAKAPSVVLRQTAGAVVADGPAPSLCAQCRLVQVFVPDDVAKVQIGWLWLAEAALMSSPGKQGT